MMSRHLIQVYLRYPKEKRGAKKAFKEISFEI